MGAGNVVSPLFTVRNQWDTGGTNTKRAGRSCELRYPALTPDYTGGSRE